MPRKYPYFELVVCEVHESTPGNLYSYISFRENNINGLEIPSLTAAHSIAKLCRVKEYRIKQFVSDESLWGTLVFTTPRILNIETMEKQREQRSLAHRYALAEAINAQPLGKAIDFPYGFTLHLSRSKARFDPKVSSRVLYLLKAELVYHRLPGPGVVFNLDDFMQTGRDHNTISVRKKEFLEYLQQHAKVSLTPEEIRRLVNLAALRKSEWANQLRTLVKLQEETT
jgi:hypothetical protein